MALNAFASHGQWRMTVAEDGAARPSIERRQAPAVVRTAAAAAGVAAASVVAVVCGASGSPGSEVVPPAEASVFHFRGERPTKILGLTADRYLSVCPSTPNCVSTSADAYSSAYVPPWTYNPEVVDAVEGANPTGKKKTMEEAIGDLKEVLAAYKGEAPTLISERAVKNQFGEGYYMYVEFETPLMGFVDDTEFFFEPDGKTVSYRSASRLGQDDQNANRKRIKSLRVALQERGWKSVGFQ